MSENANKWYVADGRTDKERFIETWTPSVGKEEAERSWAAKQEKIDRRASMVMGDIQPYISQIDGSLIESRSKHRAHLKAHNCIEVGNETKELYKKSYNKPLDAAPGLKEAIIRATEEVQSKRRR